jgi:hypothetical protein
MVGRPWTFLLLLVGPGPTSLMHSARSNNRHPKATQSLCLLAFEEYNKRIFKYTKMYLGYKEVPYVFVYLFFGFLQPFSNDPFQYFIQHCFICRLSDCTATEPGNTAKFALTIRTDNLKSAFH